MQLIMHNVDTSWQHFGTIVVDVASVIRQITTQGLFVQVTYLAESRPCYERL